MGGAVSPWETASTTAQPQRREPRARRQSPRHLPGSKATGINKVTSGKQWRGWRGAGEKMVAASDWRHWDRGGTSAIFKATRVQPKLRTTPQGPWGRKGCAPGSKWTQLGGRAGAEGRGPRWLSVILTLSLRAPWALRGLVPGHSDYAMPRCILLASCGGSADSLGRDGSSANCNSFSLEKAV